MINNNKVKIISAIGNKNEIGIGLALPWKMRSDLQFFKSITLNSAVVMGNTTYVSIGKPLPNRHNIVLSTNKNLKKDNTENLVFVSSKKELINYLNTIDTEINIIGGAKIYDLFLNDVELSELVDELVITHVDTELTPEDTNDNENPIVYFPEINPTKWYGEDFGLVFKKDIHNEHNAKVVNYFKINE